MGGGVFARYSNPQLENVLITGCSAWAGSAIYSYNPGGSDTTTIKNCVFSGNSAGGNDGTVHFNSSHLKLVNTLISDNSGGGLLIQGSNNMSIINSTIINNVNDINVLGKGSLAGVDLDRFCIDDFPEIESARKKLGIPKNSFVFISLSRLNYEKGIYELLDAFNIVVEQYSQSFLLLVGPIDEPNSRLSKIVENFHQIKLFPYSPRPELYLSASDVLCVPSHREGFGSVVLEAAAMGIPAIGSNVVGLKDSIKHNETGILFEAGNFKELARLMVLMIEDQELKQRLQKQAQENVLKYYRSDIVSEQMISEYRQLI